MSGVMRCEVRDTGIGIPADHMDALFNHFRSSMPRPRAGLEARDS